MTEKEVIKVAKKKAKLAEKTDLDWNTWFDSTDYKDYVAEYKKTYGSFAPELTPLEQVEVNAKLIAGYQGKLASASGAQQISLREDLVKTVAQTAQLQIEEYDTAVVSKLAEAKESVESHITDLKVSAYNIATYLTDAEVEAELADISFANFWDSGVEEETLSAASSYKTKVNNLALKLIDAAESIVAADKKGAELFS